MKQTNKYKSLLDKRYTQEIFMSTMKIGWCTTFTNSRVSYINIYN